MAAKGDLMTSGAAGVERAAPGEVRVRRALLSVSEKAGIVDFARGLGELGVEIVSTGGTARELDDAGVASRPIEDFTGFPEMMDGRVKTLHPRLYAGLLARRDDEEHLAAAAEHEIEQVDLVCVNLYPFEQTVARGDASEQEIVENIDIGGPTMIRAAAKNNAFAAVVVDPADYERLLAELGDSGGRLSLATRTELAAKAFACTARYDAAISTWFATRTYEGFPPAWRDAYEKVTDLRYGENPHQRAAFYARVGLAHAPARRGRAAARQGAVVQQPARSQRRARARRGVRRAGVRDRQAQQPLRLRGRRQRPRRLRTRLRVRPAERLRRRDRRSTAPSTSSSRKRSPSSSSRCCSRPATTRRRSRCCRRRRTCACSSSPSWPAPLREVEAKPVHRRSARADPRRGLRDARADARDERRAAERGAVAGHAVRVEGLPPRALQRDRDRRGGATIGIGAGQMSRVDAVRIAVEKARAAQPEKLVAAAIASDAYFPFPDGVEARLQAGVGAIIQPGGSVRDEQVVAAVDAAGATMVATDRRHFRH